jgi:peptide/nickel transport system permease protein
MDIANKSLWQLAIIQFKKNKLSMSGFWVIISIIVVALFADFLASDKPLIMKYEGNLYFPIVRSYSVALGAARWQPAFVNKSFKKDLAYEWAIFPVVPYTANNIDMEHPLAPPGRLHWLGTDEIGRDVLAGIIHGTRISLSVGIVAVSIYIFIGILLGSLAGFYGGMVDMVISRFVEIMITFPTFFLIITVIAFLPPSIFLIMAVIGITGWPGIARFTRGEFLKVRNMEYISAAQMMGFSDLRTILVHILPNALAPVFVSAAFGVAGAILVESALSFLGFGVPATVVSWGSILSAARGNTYAWWLAVFPGFLIFITVTAYNLVGEGLRDSLDPRLK